MFVFGFRWLFLCCSSTVIFVILVYPKIMPWACQRRFSFHQFTDVGVDKRRKFVNLFWPSLCNWKACCIMRRQNVEGRCILVSELGFGFHAWRWHFGLGIISSKWSLLAALPMDSLQQSELIDFHHIIPSKGEYISNGRCWSDRHHLQLLQILREHPV